jgi:hypothetical protein
MQGYEAAREGQRFMTKDHAKFVFKLRDSDLQVCLSAHGSLQHNMSHIPSSGLLDIM